MDTCELFYRIPYDWAADLIVEIRGRPTFAKNRPRHDVLIHVGALDKPIGQVDVNEPCRVKLRREGAAGLRESLRA